MSAEPLTLEAIHDFAAKLHQPGLRPNVLAYIQWQRASRAAQVQGQALPEMPDIGPLSVNLDLTTACNYACDHCIDWDALNSPIRHDEARLRESLLSLQERGLKSVILIGGGEPTIYPGFEEMVTFLKQRGLQVAVVSNGSRNDRLARIAPLLGREDWIRLSLDAGSNEVFQAMHRPKGKGIDLDFICESARKIKAANPRVTLGFSFVIVWRGAQRDAVNLIENVDEMAQAAKRARDHGFDYISFKPYLLRAENGAEVLDPEQAEAEHAIVLERIRDQVRLAREYETEDFRVLESTNLRVLEAGNWQEYTKQPRECHMQVLRQVLSPLGVFNCPAHRGVEKARVGDKAAWAGDAQTAMSGTARLIREFDAERECGEVTCLYNPVNWYLEQWIRAEEDPAEHFPIGADEGDAFL